MATEIESGFLANASRFPKEHSFLEGSQALPVCPSGKSSMYINVSMKYWRNDTDIDKTEVLGERHVSPFFPPQSSNRLIWDRTRASAMRGLKTKERQRRN
jgi:hypothetical protein